MLARLEREPGVPEQPDMFPAAAENYQQVAKPDEALSAPGVHYLQGFPYGRPEART